MRAVLEGRDTLTLMPTGSGKSLTYQLAAMLRPEPTLVLSPLIALMKDQVDKLPPALAATATFVNSSLSAEESAARLAEVAAGRTRLVYAAPERLRQARFVKMLSEVGIGLVVVDEVHCVSMWGHDFRPDYLFIRRALEELGATTLLGMTATATPETARDIGRALGRELEVVSTTVVRPNLRYDVEEVANAEDRLRVLVDGLRGLGEGSAIVYARSRRSTEELARVLRGHGFRVEHYHAGLESEERTRVQDDFVSGRVQAVVATTAFGMGIDKPDVRLVCLVNYPSSLEEYVQMVGRAGRDGEPSRTLLLASPTDAAALRRFAVSDVPAASELRAVYRAVRDAGGAVDPDELGAVVPERDPRVLVGMLEQAGLVERGFDDGRRMQIALPAAPEDAGRARRGAPPPRGARRRVAGGPDRRLRRDASLPARAGRGALRRGLPRPVRRVRRVCPPHLGRRPLGSAAAAAGGRRRGDRGGRGRAALAARPPQPRRDAARIPESAALGASLPRVPAARRRVRGRRQALGAAPGALWSAGRDDDRRRLPRAARRHERAAAAHPHCAGHADRRGRGPRRPTARLAPRALAGGRGPGVRRAPRRDPP